MKKLLILGLGNDHQCDDGIGAKIVSDLSQIINDPQIGFETLITGNLDILGTISGYESVIIIDGTKNDSGIPGNVYHFPFEKYQPTIHLENFHDSNFVETIHLGRLIGFPIPENIYIIAVEISETMWFSKSLSTALQESYPDILEKIIAILKIQIQKEPVTSSSSGFTKRLRQWIIRTDII
jgi:hydrogenase maturation protease